MTAAALEDAPRLNRRQQAKAATRAKVLKAAADLFADVGYADAGMSTGAVFANFQDKAELWREAMKAPEPDSLLADEIALTNGRWPTATLVFHASANGWTVIICGPIENPRQLGHGAAETMADALRAARFAALAAAEQAEAA
jgi:hypothetical protein